MNYIRNFLAAIIFLCLKYLFQFRSDSHSKSNKVLILNLGLLGDVVMSTILFANEKAFEKKLEITYLVNELYKDIFRNYDGKIKILYIDKTKYSSSIRYRIKYLNDLYSKYYCKVLNLNFYRLSIDDEITLIAGLNGQTYSFENYPSLFRLFYSIFDKSYTQIISINKKSFVENYATCLNLILPKNTKIDLRTTLSKSSEGCLERYDLTSGNYFVISPFSTSSIKNWEIEKYFTVSKILSQKLNMLSVIVGDKNKLLSTHDNCINLLGKTNLGEVSCIIEHSKFFIGNDSGLLHVAIAYKKKTYGIIGGGVHEIVYPYSKFDNTNYLYSNCEFLGCRWECKFDYTHCLANINEKEIIDLIVDSEKYILDS